GSGVLQALYVFLLYRAYSTSNLTLVYPLSRGMGVLGTFLVEAVLIPHPWTNLQIIGILLSVGGTSCLALPNLDGKDKKGVLYSLATGVVLSFVFLIGRFSSKHISAFPYLWGMYAA